MLSYPLKCGLLQHRSLPMEVRLTFVVIPTQMRASTTLSFRATWKNRIRILPKFIPFIFKRLSIAFSVFRKCMHFKIAKQALLQVFTAKPVHNQAHTPQKNFARQKPPETETPFCEKRHSHTPPASTQRAPAREAFSQMNAPGMPAPPFAKNKAGTQYAAIIIIGCIGLFCDMFLAWFGRQIFPWESKHKGIFYRAMEEIFGPRDQVFSIVLSQEERRKRDEQHSA